MNTYVIYGADSVVGANFASVLSQDSQVVGICDQPVSNLPQCELISGSAASVQIDQLLKDLKPTAVIDASCAGDSPWNPNASIASEEQCERSQELASVCSQLEIPYTFISSDAVLTGPWMFHEEDSEAECASIVGKRLLDLEWYILHNIPEALVVRTHPFGWNLNETEQGWVENLLEELQTRRNVSQINQPGYATPIVATELARIVQRAMNEQCTGLYHIAGAERVNRLQFTRRLAQQFDLSWLCITSSGEHFTESERSRFGCGESSLQTRAIRRDLCVAMPTLTESIEQLRATCPSETSWTSSPVSRAA